MRVLGLDYGTKTIGVAISDPLGWTAQGLETITRQDPRNLIDSIKRINELCIEYQVELIIVGLPKNMDKLKRKAEDTAAAAAAAASSAAKKIKLEVSFLL